MNGPNVEVIALKAMTSHYCSVCQIVTGKSEISKTVSIYFAQTPFHIFNIEPLLKNVGPSVDIAGVPCDVLAQCRKTYGVPLGTYYHCYNSS